MYHTKSQAARHAAKKIGPTFETVAFRKPTGDVVWFYKKREPNAASKYAVIYASTRDWIHHTEVTEDGKAVLVVTLPKNELPTGIPPMFLIAPITPQLWEVSRTRSTTGL